MLMQSGSFAGKFQDETSSESSDDSLDAHVAAVDACLGNDSNPTCGMAMIPENLRQLAWEPKQGPGKNAWNFSRPLIIKAFTKAVILKSPNNFNWPLIL